MKVYQYVVVLNPTPEEEASGKTGKILQESITLGVDQIDACRQVLKAFPRHVIEEQVNHMQILIKPFIDHACETKKQILNTQPNTTVPGPVSYHFTVHNYSLETPKIIWARDILNLAEE